MASSNLPPEVCAMIEQFHELVPGVPSDEKTMTQMLEHFWEDKSAVLKRLEPGLEIQIGSEQHYKRKRDGTTEKVYHAVDFMVFKLLEPQPNGFRPRIALYDGKVKQKDDIKGFMDQLTECRRVLRLVRAGGLCSCNRRLKIEGARLCAKCACEEFLQ